MAIDLKKMSIAQITVVYNDAALKLGVNTRKGFPDKTTAVKKTIAILAEVKDSGKAKAKSGRKSITAKTVEFPLPAAEVLAKIPRTHGLGGMILAAMEKGGATLDQMTKIVHEHDKDRKKNRISKRDPEKRARLQMLWLNWRCGYGLRQEGKKYFVVTPKKGPVKKGAAKK